MERRSAERIIIFVYTIYALAFMFASTILGWPGWITPVTSVGVLTVWIIYLRELKDYRIRSLLYSGVVLATFVLYNIQEDSFGGILITYCAAVAVLSILDISDIVVPQYLCSILLIAYHGFVSRTIPYATTQEKIRSAVQIISVFAVVAVTHHLIKKHEEIGRNMRGMISELEEAERSKVDFLANVSHEFSTPVNTIYGIGEMILQENVSDNIKEEALSIQAAGRDLLSMISDVLDFSELESGKMTIAEEPYHLTSTINEVISMAIAYRGTKNLELIVDCDPRIPCMLRGDEGKLRRVILNLVDNAVKFTQEGCVTIVISARPEEYGVNLCVKVRDTGIGIAEENQERLFSSFNQADTTRSRQQGGIGIGLPISKKLVQKMNGFISVKSELGRGSEFQFVIPQKVDDSSPIVTVSGAENMNIMVYIDTEKTTFTQIRDDYMSSIRRMMEGLEIRYRQCRNLGELKRRMEREVYTHLLISWEEYLEEPAYFAALSEQMGIIMIQDRQSGIVPGGKIQSLYKPFYAQPFAAILNGSSGPEIGSRSVPENRQFTAPTACVLVVDDNLMNLKVAQGLLRPYKIKVVTASSGEDCLSKAETVHCDMIFMDHMMPGMDGVETLQRLRKKPGVRFREVPVIALTANAVEGAREMFLQEGFQEYISKPIETGYLEKVLKKYIPADKLVWEEPQKSADEKKTEILPEKKTARINREKGIEHMGGSSQDYDEVLQVYLEEGRDVLQELEKDYQGQDWKRYIIYVHSLKSNSFGIGADELGELAKSLEFAGKEGDISYIQTHHDEMMKLYREVLSEIEEASSEMRTTEGGECGCSGS